MKVKTRTASNMMFFILGVAMYLVNMLLTDQTAWHGYFFMFALGGLVYAAYRPASPFYPPLMLYLWFSLFNFRTIALLHVGQEEGAKYFTYTILPQAWHYQVMIQEQFLFALPMLFISMFLSRRQVAPGQSPGIYSLTKHYWYVFYAIGLLAMVFLVLKGGGLDAASYSRTTRVIGAGWIVVAQYMLVVGIGLFLINSKHKSMAYHLLMATALAAPSILTGERSFFIGTILSVLAYHAIYTKQLLNRHLVFIAPTMVIGTLMVGLWRYYSSAAADVAERGLFDALTNDASFGTGYLIFRELGIDFEPPMTTLLLSFTFFSSGLKLVLGTLPILPNTAFSQAMFADASAAGTTFSMGLLGEAHYMFGEFRILYYFGVACVIHWLADVVAKTDSVAMIFISGFVFRVAKGGATGGLTAIWVIVILLIGVRLVGYFLKLPQKKNRGFNTN